MSVLFIHQRTHHTLRLRRPSRLNGWKLRFMSVNEGDVARDSPLHGTLWVRTSTMKGVRTSTALYTT